MHGELKLQVLTDRVEQLLHLETVYLTPSPPLLQERGGTPYKVERFTWHRNDLLLKLSGCDDRTQAEALQGQLVQMNLQDAAPLGPNEYYTFQLIGIKVVTLEGEELGTLDEILETGANDVYVVHGPRGEILLPARIEVVRQVDLEHGVMTVYLMPGLVE